MIEIAGYKFRGIIDLVLKHKITGAIIVVDHKSKKYQGLMDDLDFYKKQLYTYAIYVKEKYGVFPDELWFNVFREQKFIKEQFSKDEYDKTIRWVVDTIESVYQTDMFDEEWDRRKDNDKSYFCKFICGVRNQCWSDYY